MNKQREVIYAQRRQILSGEHLQEDIWTWPGTGGGTGGGIHRQQTPGRVGPGRLGLAFQRQFGLRLPLANLDGDLRELLEERVKERFAAKAEEIGPELFGQLQQMVMLQIVDNSGRTTCSPWITCGTASA